MDQMTETTTSSPVKLTEGAVQQLKRIRDDQGIPAEYALRVGVKGGGCSGFSYLLGFDEVKERDSTSICRLRRRTIVDPSQTPLPERGPNPEQRRGEV